MKLCVDIPEGWRDGVRYNTFTVPIGKHGVHELLVSHSHKGSPEVAVVFNVNNVPATAIWLHKATDCRTMNGVTYTLKLRDGFMRKKHEVWIETIDGDPT